MSLPNGASIVRGGGNPAGNRCELTRSAIRVGSASSHKALTLASMTRRVFAVRKTTSKAQRLAGTSTPSIGSQRI
jgi:hypothetical protein